MIRTVIFDMGKVIIPFDFKVAYEKLGPLCRYSPAEIPERLRPHDLVHRLESGRVEPQAFLRELSEILELDCPYEDFCDIFASIFSRETLIPEEFLAALRERYRLLLLSNTNAIHFEFIEREYPILRHFHELVLSYRVGAMKPEPKIYEAAIAAAGCAPGECFFTDDIPAYVAAAKSHGIDAVVFQGYGQIVDELRNRGVVCDGV
jgi:glucose-1-phosphatase